MGGDMAETTITGASDDLIEIAGQLSEELNYYMTEEDHEGLLAFSDGTLLGIKYDSDGIWRIRRLAEGACQFELVAGSVEEDMPDMAILRGDLRWCLFGERGQYNPVWPRKPKK